MPRSASAPCTGEGSWLLLLLQGPLLLPDSCQTHAQVLCDVMESVADDSMSIVGRSERGPPCGLRKRTTQGAQHTHRTRGMQASSALPRRCRQQRAWRCMRWACTSSRSCTSGRPSGQTPWRPGPCRMGSCPGPLPPAATPTTARATQARVPDCLQLFILQSL